MDSLAPITADAARWSDFLMSGGDDERVAEVWAGYARHCVRIELGAPLAEPQTPGVSKFFGPPNSFLLYGWPEDAAPGLFLLAQINLADIAEMNTSLDLPRSGLLRFFYDMEKQPWGFDPKDAAGFKVEYLADSNASSAPDNPNASRAYRLDFKQSASLPDWWWLVDKLKGRPEFAEDDVDSLFTRFDGDILDEIINEGNQMGGWPDPVQNPMELECQLVSNGIYCGNEGGYASPRAEELASGADDWRLLLQLDSMERELGWLWGDAGMLYFWCREQDIAARRFDRAWVIQQCG